MNPFSAILNAGISPILKGVGGLAKDIRAAITGKSILDPDKQAELSMRLMEIEVEAQKADNKLDELRTNIIVAEAQGDGMIQRNWRPVTMLVFVALIVAKWFGYSAEGITPELEMKLFEIVQLGLGGYVVGRSAEKVARVWKGDK